MVDPSLLVAVAASIAAGEPEVDAIVARLTTTVGQPRLWMRPLAERYLKFFHGGTRPRLYEVVAFLEKQRSLRKLSVKRWLTEPQRMQPVEAAKHWDLPAIETVGDLARWLQLEPTELDWFADLKGINRGKLDHYHYRVLSKGSGGLRVIEAPKPRLKRIQIQILERILSRIQPHPAAHGIVKGRSIQSFSLPHVGQHVVLKMDLQDYFPSFRASRIQAFFRTAGYPESVADLLGGLCTNVGPLKRPHLPQGAPTSPALANLATYHTDCRLAGLAKSAGAQYTRYADDLVFSGDATFERRVERFSIHAAAILMEEGFAVHHRKTRIMRQSVRQQIVGLLVNERLNIRRDDFDLLKAILHNCVRHGPASQNHDAHPSFRAHLEGRIAFVASVHPARALRLRAMFDRIPWDT